MKYQAEPGDSIYNAALKAIKLARTKIEGEVTLVFNEIEILVDRDSFDCDIATIYNLKSEIRRLQNRR